MFKRTKTVLIEILARSTVFEDPAPMPTRYFSKDAKDISKALVEDIKEIWQNKMRLTA